MCPCPRSASRSAWEARPSGPASCRVYADSRQLRADFWAIAAGLLAALTSLSIFPVLGDNSTDLQKWAISIVAFLAAICALIPRVKNYGELAGQARELASRYGSLEGDLLDLSKTDPIDQERARTIVTEFQATKEKKDGLRGLPTGRGWRSGAPAPRSSSPRRARAWRTPTRSIRSGPGPRRGRLSRRPRRPGPARRPP